MTLWLLRRGRVLTRLWGSLLVITTVVVVVSVVVRGSGCGSSSVLIRRWRVVSGRGRGGGSIVIRCACYTCVGVVAGV